jgi:hypothetical protein
MNQSQSLPEPLKSVVRVKAPGIGRSREIKIWGHRDPRGPDNNVYVWVDDDDKLHIRVWKTDRCYKFEEVLNEDGFVEIIAG